MAPAPNSLLGNYEILDRLGAGGMGEVYRARDTRLGRVVAIKVILEAYASDPERVGRFQREARLLAALNHPRIAALYGIEQAGDVHFLVMELVEGETLADRLRRGAMQVEEAIAVGLQIAEALEAAHEKGVIHRDLKPANVKITPDSQVKVLDFGLAKAVENETSQEAANSPTLSMMATQAGLILGTAAYMSPEQAKGFAADHRSDVFSFGTVLFEMLTGRQPFQGDTAAEILASVLVREPELSGLPTDTNPRLSEVITRCLQKNPKRRWQHIGDVRAELEAISSSPRSMISTGIPAGPPKPLWKRALVPAACAVIAASLTGSMAWWLKPAPARAPLISFSHVLPEGQRFAAMGRPILAISPDGSDLIYAVAGERRLHRRPLAELGGAPIQGSQDAVNASAPAISPDGQSVVYFAISDRTLKRIPVTGGVPLTICESTNPAGIDWSPAGIVFADNSGIMRVPAGGGRPEMLVPRAADVFMQMPQMLPDGETLLFSVTSSNAANRWDVGRVVVHSLKTGAQRTVIEPGSSARYLRSGHIVYTMGGTLFAIAFDVDRLETRGTPVPAIEGVARATPTVTGVSQFAVSENGTIAYVPGAVGVSSGLDIFVTDRAGAELKLMKLPLAAYNNPRVSRDNVVAIESDDGRSVQVFVYDLAGTSAIRRLTFGGSNRFPMWTADGRRVTFQSDREGDAGIFWQDRDGAGTAERLTRAEDGESHIPESWAPDGQSLLLTVLKNGKHTLSVFSLRDRKVMSLPGVESTNPIDAVFHPNGKWVAYRAGSPADVYVQPFPPTGAQYQLPRQRSGDVPHNPVWSPDGTELMYVPRPGEMEAVRVTTRPTFAFSNPRAVNRPFQLAGPLLRRRFDVLRDGRFTGVTPVETAGTPAGSAQPRFEIRVMLNWTDHLRTLLSAR